MVLGNSPILEQKSFILLLKENSAQKFGPRTLFTKKKSVIESCTRIQFQERISICRHFALKSLCSIVHGKKISNDLK